MSSQRKCPGAGQKTAESIASRGDWTGCPVCHKRTRATLAGAVGYHASAAVQSDARKVVDYEFTAEGMRPIYADEVAE